MRREGIERTKRNQHLKFQVVVVCGEFALTFARVRLTIKNTKIFLYIDFLQLIIILLEWKSIYNPILVIFVGFYSKIKTRTQQQQQQNKD